MGEHQQLNSSVTEEEKVFSSFLKEYWIAITAAVLFVLFANFIMTTVIVRMNQPRIVTFDIKGVTDNFVQRTAMLGDKATEEQVKVMTQTFNQSMKDQLDQYESKGYIIVVKPAVIAGAQDITDDVRAAIYKKIRGE